VIFLLSIIQHFALSTAPLGVAYSQTAPASAQWLRTLQAAIAGQIALCGGLVIRANVCVTQASLGLLARTQSFMNWILSAKTTVQDMGLAQMGPVSVMMVGLLPTVRNFWVKATRLAQKTAARKERV